MTGFYAHVEAVAEILRTHQYDDGGRPEWSDRCFCGTPMGDQERHQAIAIVEAGWTLQGSVND